MNLTQLRCKHCGDKWFPRIKTIPVKCPHCKSPHWRSFPKKVPNLPHERWVSIVELPDYAISNFGRIKRLTRGQGTWFGRLLKAPLNQTGYPAVTLARKKSYLVHRLVATAFLGPCPKGYETNHLNGIKSDPRVCNLEWVTRSENAFHANRTGLRNVKGERHPESKLTEVDVRFILNAPSTYGYRIRLAKRFNVSVSLIRNIRGHQSWTHLHS